MREAASEAIQYAEGAGARADPSATLPLSALDVFCGCGGLTTGLKQAGFTVVGAIDIDELATESYALNHPEPVLWCADVATLPSAEILRQLSLRPGELDLLAGCPPCQGFSSLRTLNGRRSVVDTRNDLVFEYLRLITDLRPRAVMMENVPALERDRRFRSLLGSLGELGYQAEYRVLDASEYGVPQRRKRLILIAALGSSPRFAAPSNECVTVRDAIGRLPRPAQTLDPLHRIVGHHSDRVRELIRKVPKNGGSRRDLDKKSILPCHRRSDGFFDVYGRMRWDDVAPTITTGFINPSRGRFLHPRQDRAITLREGALLQSFPSDYALSLREGRYGAARLVGNALPPEFIRRHASTIRTMLLKSRP